MTEKCNHSGVKNLGDGEYTCSNDDCDIRFGRVRAKEKMMGKSKQAPGSKRNNKLKSWLGGEDAQPPLNGDRVERNLSVDESGFRASTTVHAKVSTDE